jgi:hypothetical protein
MEIIDIHSTTMSQRRRDELELLRLCIAADRKAHEQMKGVYWPTNESDGWFMRKIVNPIMNYLCYLAR